ncbi:ABC transporter substrate-binding protein [Crenobacter intestini]|uniref:Thiamine pyrimidine synthase n=1 Tax=Crenobacter intestini TaxID=2563443 RepID=A0A4T0V5T5_9NEIS|nr:ABC transporter substrate-binding protein [Crenobacter intestini]TIC87128.1 ABC transporter substrate-binding protein [Crenobacter intestini]
MKINRRMLLPVMATLCLFPATATLAATPEKVRFTLDWRMEGPAAPFLLARDKGYFAAEGLDVSIDVGTGSAGAVTRVASGAYDIGFADFNALVEYEAKTPGSRVQGIYMVYNTTPAAIISLKDKSINRPADLVGKTLAAPIFDAGRKAWPAFAKSNQIAPTSVTWQTVEPALRETLLARGDVDAITGFSFTSVLNLESRGVKPDDIRVMPYSKHGVEAYGNTLIASSDLIRNKPKVVAGFVRAFNKALKETLANPEAAVAHVKRQDPLVNEALELRRLKLALAACVVTPETRSAGLGTVNPARMQRAIEETAAAYGLATIPAADVLFTGAFLPPKSALMIK